MPRSRADKRSPLTPATLYDVARVSGVSSATVSRVFNGRVRVSEQVRERVMDAARQLAYEPSHAARALAGCSTKTIGAIFPEIASGFYADVLAGVDEVAAESGFDVLAAFVGSHRHRPHVVHRLLRQGRVDAMVLLNTQAETDLEPAAVEGLPIVLVDREISGTTLPVIGMDNVGGAAAVIGHLYEQGHRRIGLVTGPPHNHDSEQRMAGCTAALARLGLPFDERLVVAGDFTLESGTRAARHFLSASGGSTRKSPLPDAIFCFNDLMAIGMLAEFRRAGLSVPRDVALAGYDDIETAAHIALTSVASPMRLMGQIAARWAIDLITTGARPASHNLPVRLVVRHSSMRPSRAATNAHADGTYDAALAHIQDDTRPDRTDPDARVDADALVDIGDRMG